MWLKLTRDDFFSFKITKLDYMDNVYYFGFLKVNHICEKKNLVDEKTGFLVHIHSHVLEMKRMCWCVLKKKNLEKKNYVRNYFGCLKHL